MSHLLLLLLLLLKLLLVPVIWAYPDGSGSCFEQAADLQLFAQHHGGPEYSSTNQQQFRILVSATHYLPGCRYRISLCCAAHKGFMLYARAPGASRVGTFELDSTLATTTKFKNCGSSLASTLTHTNNAVKSAMHFVWIAPGSNYPSPSITLASTIVVGPASNWFDSSIELPLNTNLSAACPSVPAANVCPPPFDGSGTDAHDHSGMSDDAAAGGHHGAHGSSAVFNSNWQGLVIVFQGWVLSDTRAYVSSLIGVAVIALVFELLHIFQQTLDARFQHTNVQQQQQQQQQQHQQQQGERECCSPAPADADADVAAAAAVVTVVSDEKTSRGTRLRSFSSSSSYAFANNNRGLPFTCQQQNIRAALHITRVFVSFFLMMVFMTLDIGLVIAMLFGGWVGFLLFTRDKPVVAASPLQAGCHG
jgi:hypothetical protein